MKTFARLGLSLVLIAWSTLAADSPATKAPGQYANVHGLKMYFEVHGQGAPLVLLHGGTGWIDLWPEARDYFAKGYKVIAPEQMGHGHTPDDPKRPLDYHAMAEDTVELLRQQHIDSAFILGWSDGGIVALDIAINHPGLVKKLAASGANIHPVTDPKFVEWSKHVKAECGPKDKEWEDCWPVKFRDGYLKIAPDPGHFPAFLERIKKMWATQPNMTKGQLAKVTSPALIIAGDHDNIAIRETVEIFESIPSARLWIVPNSTHFVPIERAESFNRTVDEFFKEPPPAKSK
jgi:pimeloyl-ACP methyl ester carboxylesterase